MKFYLRTPQAKESRVYIVAHHRGRRYIISTGETVKTAYWKTKRVAESSRYKESTTINIHLAAWEKVISDAFDYFGIKTPDPAELRAKIDNLINGTQNSDSLIQWVTDYIPRCNKSALTTRNYKFTLNVLKSYNPRLRFRDITIDFYKDFQRWSDKNGYTLNTFGSFIKHIKAWMNEAEDEIGHGNTGHLHKKFSTISETADTVYLDLDELIAIRDLVITWETVMDYFNLPAHKAGLKATSMNLARDRFLIGAFTGLRVGDFTRLSPANVSGGYIKILPHKGAMKGTEVIIPLHPVVREIMGRIDFSVKSYDTKINKQIKDICRMAGINQQVAVTRTEGGHKLTTWKPKYDLITTHTARRSAATNMYKSGIPTLAIMKITGHRTEKSFLKYIKVTAEENAEILKNHNFFK